MTLMQKLVTGAIVRYQSSGGGVEHFRVDCNFHPTCSEYARQAVQRFGVWQGLKLALKRIRHCNDPDLPHPAVDEVPVHLNRE